MRRDLIALRLSRCPYAPLPDIPFRASAARVTRFRRRGCSRDRDGIHVPFGRIGLRRNRQGVGTGFGERETILSVGIGSGIVQSEQGGAVNLHLQESVRVPRPLPRHRHRSSHGRGLRSRH